MRGRFLIASVAGLGLFAALGWHARTCRAGDRRQGRPDRSQPPARETLRMSKAVVCRSIDGYEAYEPLPDAAQTSEEKLLVYYRPLGYKTTLVNDKYQAHLTQDAEIRRRGQKAVVRQKKKMLDYTAESPQPPELIYLRNMISLKGLKPGEYDLSIILHDELAQGPPAIQVVRFRVIPTEDPTKKGEAGATGDRTAARIKNREKKPRPARQVSPDEVGVEDSLLVQFWLEWQLSGGSEDIE